MTECERIIKEGLLPERFFDEENKCDFFVTEDLKKIQAIELDLVAKFDVFCKKFNLHYFLIGGSLLGAVRHHGFIPWDDDMDIILPRKDYDRMLKLAPQYFKNQYFFQTIETDPEFCYLHARLRNSNTSAIDRPFSFQNYNHGIFIDILPLDNFVETIDEHNYDLCNKKAIDNSTFMKKSNPFPADKDKERIRNYVGQPPIDNFLFLNELGRNNLSVETNYVTCFAGTVYGLQKSKHYKSDYRNSVSIDFEGISLQIPVGYEKILETTYGDYTKYPPKELRGAWHGNITFNADLPYNQLLPKYRELIIREGGK